MSLKFLSLFCCQFFLLAGLSLLSAQEVVLPAESDSLPKAIAGKLLLSELGCAACHEGAGEFKSGPILTEVGERIQDDYLRKYIARPHAVKPGTTMPDLLADQSEDEKDRIATEITSYLLGFQKTSLPLQEIEVEAAVRGEKLFREVGCAACHNFEDQKMKGSSPLLGLPEKYFLESLTTFLEDPLAVRPSGRMPDMRLTHWEALDLAHYLLLEQKSEQAAGDRKIDEKQQQAGEKHFKTLGCAQCHNAEAAQQDFGKAFSELALAQNCTQAHYPLSKEQLGLIAGVSLQKKETPQETITLKMAQLNCYACHSRDERGGVTAERDSYFTTTNLNLGDQARIPPSLTGVGAKLKTAALRRILIGDGSVRPYMNTRMPRFGSPNVEELIPLLKEVDQREPREISRLPKKSEAMKLGHALVGEKNLACNSCHTFFGEKSTTLNALDLTLMWERLEEDWFHRYLRNPHEFNAATIMPGFWPNGKSVRPEILEGDADLQIDAIWQYLSKGQEARRPAGVRPEPIPYGPENGEAVMLRRQYTGIGKRGIGVGYPSGINLSFDASKLALGSIWKGKFAEMSPVWRGQGSGFVKEAGDGLVRMVAGPSFAKLEAVDDEWPLVPEGRERARFSSCLVTRWMKSSVRPSAINSRG